MKRFPLASKIALLIGLTLVLLLPISAIMGLIDERAAYRQSVINQVAGSTSGPQTIVGPIIVIPYETEEWRGTDKERQRVVLKHNFYVLPETLDATATAQVEERHIGIYQAQVYDSNVALKGRFTIPALTELINKGASLGQPYLSLAVGDARGIRRISRFRLQEANTPETELAFEAGSQLKAFDQGLHVPLTLKNAQQTQTFDFSLDLGLQGTGSLAMTPVGATSTLSLTSNWPHPNFLGSFLPDRRDISAQGFSAQWSSTWFANNINSRLVEMFNNGQSNNGYGNAAYSALPNFSVTLVEAVGQYQLNERSVKYAILFIGLTFIAFFLFEMLKALRVHPIQYLLVGAALVLFYLLLLALSEHLGFNTAYAAASLACIGLITYYVSHVLKSVKRGAGFGVMLTTLYAVLWGLLQSEDNALLLGSLLLFGVLALIMALTRKINWYALGTDNSNVNTPASSASTPQKT